jgi:glutathione S-transferase
VLKDGDFTLPDSSCVIAYLERVHPTPALYPSDPKLYGRALFYEEYADTRLIETFAPVFFERVIKVLILKQKPDEAKVKDALEKTPAVLDWLESQVPASGDAILGGRFSTADIALASPFVNWEHGGERVDAKRWPKLAAYIDRIHARPSFKACIEEERKDFGR